jgi:hypothetical protein
MQPFDPKAYEEAVVKPLRRWSGRELPDDLIARYAVDLAMSDLQLAQRLKEVRSKWNKGIGGAGFAQKVYRAFLNADKHFQEEHGTQLARIAWWQAYAASRVGARKELIDDLAKTLRANFGELGLIAPGQLDATVRAAYVSLSPDEVDEALTKAGVRRCPPVDLPKASGLLDTTYRHLRDHLIDAEKSSVVELVHGEPAPFRLLDDSAAADLSAAAVRSATDRENKRAGNQGARQALAILATAAKDDLDLRKLALFHLLDDVRQQHGHGVPHSALLKQLLQAKLEPEEARFAVFSVLNESHRGPAGNLTSIRELTEQGRLVAAQQMLASIVGADDAAAATALIERQLIKVRELIDAARRALREGAEADAAHLFRQAVALASDDQDLRAEFRRIPPEPVLEVSAREEGIAVRVSWRPAASHDDNTRYRLVRRDGRVPGDADDGIVIAAEVGRTVSVDPKAPAGASVGYAVFTSVEGGPWSRPAGVRIEVLPGVGDVRLAFVDGVVEGHWAVHPEVAGVDVHRGDGVTIQTSGRTRFRDRTAPEGSEQVYTFVARYRRSDGTEAMSAPVRARATATGQPLPLRALSLKPVEGEAGRPKIALTWKQQPDAEVVIRRATVPPRWAFGNVVPVSELAGYGAEVAGRRDEQDGWQTLTADVPTGLFHYVPFTLGRDGAICGHGEKLGIALPIGGLRHQRFGEELLLAWEWPEQVGTAQVRWRTELDAGSTQLTRQQYQTGGGCRVHCGPGRVTVLVRTKVLAEGGECMSPYVELVVSERLPAVSYTVDMTRKPVIGGGTVRVRLTADQEVARCVVVVVAAQGPVMPRQATDGRELVRGERALRPGDEVELTAELPRLRRPYWVRCFLETEGVRLIDPSIKQLKVS